MIIKEKYADKIIKIKLKEIKLKRSSEVFFNPEMYKNRKHSFEIIKKTKPKKIIDLNAGSGILSIALAKKGFNVIANDINPKAINAIKENSKFNKVDLKIYQKDARNSFFDADCFIIDPFGSPAEYIKNILSYAKENSIVLASATDIAVLSGKYPKKAKKQYSFEIRLNPFPKEMCIRSLLAFSEITANKYNKSIEVLSAYKEKHYCKIAFKLIKIKKRKLASLCYNPKEGIADSNQKKCQKTEKFWQYRIKDILNENRFNAIKLPIINIKKYFSNKKMHFPKKSLLQKYGTIMKYDYALQIKNKDFFKYF